MKLRYQKYIIRILLVVILVTAGLIVVELQAPGTCPVYPVFGIPACMVMEIYFVFIFGSLFIPYEYIRRVTFYSATLLALGSSIFFSVNEFLGVGSCPRVFSLPIPLCYAALFSVVLVLVLGNMGYKKKI